MVSYKIMTLTFLCAVVGIVAITCSQDDGDGDDQQPWYDTDGQGNNNGNGNNGSDTDWAPDDTGEDDTGQDDTGEDDTGEDDTGEEDTGREPWPSTQIDDIFENRNCVNDPPPLTCNGAVCNVVYDNFAYHKDDCADSYYAPARCKEFERCFKESVTCFDNACAVGTRPSAMNMANKMTQVTNCLQPLDNCLNDAYEMDTDG